MSAVSLVPVVCALIERDGRILIAQRPANKHLALQWEFPGGKMEPGESAEDALRREITEELGCTLGPVRFIGTTEHDYGPVRIRLTAFAGALAPDSADPSPREHVAIRWLTPEELRIAEVAPADVPVLQAYLAATSTAAKHT